MVEKEQATDSYSMPLDDRLVYTDDGRVERKISTSYVYEFAEEDGVLSFDTLELLGVEEETREEQLKAIVDASQAVLQDFAEQSGVVVVPFEVGEPNEHGSIVISAEQVQKVEARDEEKVGYIPGVAEYYMHIFGQFEDLARGRRDDNVLYHTDLSKPSQYTYGSVGDTDPQLYFTDLDPEINTIAEEVGGAWELDEHFVQAVADLAAVSHGRMVGHEEIAELIDMLKHSKLVNGRQLRVIDYALQNGENYTQDPQQLAVV